jgi:DNA-binding CsgD family transcriptional regulator
MDLDKEPVRAIDSVMLSRREVECVEYLVRGKSLKGIGKILGLSHRTVEFYLDNIKTKLSIHSKEELIDKAIGSWYQRKI